jgi:hypothetical protein
VLPLDHAREPLQDAGYRVISGAGGDPMSKYTRFFGFPLVAALAICGLTLSGCADDDDTLRDEDSSQQIDSDYRSDSVDFDADADDGQFGVERSSTDDHDHD